MPGACYSLGAYAGSLSADGGTTTKLSELGVQEKDIDFLAESALADACTPSNL